MFTLAAASAEAAEAETRFYIENEEVKTPETYEAIVGNAQINTTIGGVKILIVCDKNSQTGIIGPEGEQTAALVLNGCSFYEIIKGEKLSSTSCEVEPEQKYEEVERERIRFTNRFPYIAIVQRVVIREDIDSLPGKTCPLAGAYEMTGSYESSVPEGYIESTEHKTVFTSTGSGLAFGKERASLTYAVSQKLKSGREWRIG